MDLFEHLPRALTASGPRGLSWWQWLALPVVASIVGLLGVVLGRLTSWLLRMVTRRTVASWDDRVLEAITAPLACLWAILLGFLAAGELHLPGPSLVFLNKALRTGALITFFWMLLRLVSLVGRSAQTAAF